MMEQLRLKEFVFYNDGNERALGVTLEGSKPALQLYRSAVSFGWDTDPQIVADRLRSLADWCESFQRGKGEWSQEKVDPNNNCSWGCVNG